MISNLGFGQAVMGTPSREQKTFDRKLQSAQTGMSRKTQQGDYDSNPNVVTTLRGSGGVPFPIYSNQYTAYMPKEFANKTPTQQYSGLLKTITPTSENLRNLIVSRIGGQLNGPDYVGTFGAAGADAAANTFRTNLDRSRASLGNRGIYDSGASSMASRLGTDAYLANQYNNTAQAGKAESDRKLSLVQQLINTANADIGFIGDVTEARQKSQASIMRAIARQAGYVKYAQMLGGAAGSALGGGGGGGGAGKFGGAGGGGETLGGLNGGN